jgi:hypothetical protein
MVIAPEQLEYAEGRKTANCNCGHSSKRHSFLAPELESVFKRHGASLCMECQCDGFMPQETKCPDK